MPQPVEFGQSALDFTGMSPMPSALFDTIPAQRPVEMYQGPVQSSAAKSQFNTQRFTMADGSVQTRDELMQSSAGRRYLATQDKTTPYDFFDAISGQGGGSWLDFVPYVGMFAQVGGSLTDAYTASQALHKMQDGQSLTSDEALKVSLMVAENDMKANGTWGATFGGIVRQAPAFFAEFAFTGGALQAARSAFVNRAAANATEASVNFLSHAGVTRATKRGATELSDMFIQSAIKADLEKGVFASASQAAKAYMESPEFIRRTTAATSEGVRRLMTESAPHVTGVRQWAPGLADKVSDTLSERAVRASLKHLSNESSWARFFDSARRAVRDSFVEGLTDLGEWGTESATTVMTSIPRASRAFAQAGLDLTIGATARGAAMFAPRELVAQGIGLGMEAVTGATPVRASTLGLEQAAWQNGDGALMSRAETYGMFLDLLEYVSESSGRGFNSLFRGIGLAVAPKLVSPAARVAGTLETKAATQVVRDAANKITDVVYDVGLVDAARHAEVGGALKRYIEKVAGGRSLKENVAADRLTAVTHKLSKMGVNVADSAALQATLDSGVAVRGLDPAVVQALGRDIGAFTKTAVKEANREGLKNMKLHGFMTYYIADFAARHNYDAARVWEKFTQMGYDGVVGEMMEERYSDVVSTLFGLDAEEKGFWDRVGTAVRRAFLPDGGFKQLTAEACGFAVPMVVRAGVMRTIAAMGTPNDYANHAAWASSVQDALHYGSIQHFQRGDYIAKVAGQAQRLRDAAAAQDEQANAATTDAQRRELARSAEGFRTAAVRAETLRDEFLRTVDPNATEFAAPVYQDAALTAPDTEYGLMPHVTAQQATSALAGYRKTLEFAGKAGQLQYKALHRAKDESSSWFRKASHWVVEHALRLGGTMATGDLSFMSANPAAFAAADKGVSQAFLDTLQKAYGNVYESTLREISSTEEPGSGGALVADTDRAHDLALARFQPQAEALMAQHLAAMQVYMFSHDELRDIALAVEAQKDGFMIDAQGRRLVGEDGQSLTYDEFLSREGVADRVSQQVESDAKIVYELLTSAGTTGSTAASLAPDIRMDDENVMLRRLIDIPKGMPAADRAVLATVLRYHPAFADAGVNGFRNVMTSTQIDPLKSLQDQLPGMSTRRGHLRLVSDVLTQGRPIASASDFRAAVARIADADPGIVELIGRDLGYSHDFTDAGKRRRDEAVARYVLMASMFDDPDSAMFTRAANLSEDEQRVGSHFSEIVPVRRTANGWTGTFLRAQDGQAETITRTTLEELEQAVADETYGYSRHERSLVHTPVRTLYADTAQEFISVLNLGRQYRERQDRIFKENQTSPNAELLKDPALRRNPDGTFRHTQEEADRVRAREAREAAEFVAHGKQQDPALYLQPGESAKDEAALARAQVRMERLRESYNSREARQKDGRALGYNAVAEDLVNEHGVRGGTNSRFGNEFGIANANLRGRFAMSIRTVSSQTGDVYVPIDHSTAQSYGSSMLSALVFNAIARGRQYVKDTFVTQIRGMLETVETIADRKIAESTDDADRARWTSFANAYVRGVRERSRKVSPKTLDAFIQAFCLYRTEVPTSELLSTLGDYAAELKEIAVEVRRSAAFVPFCAAADVILGGNGFEVNPAAGDGRGLMQYYAMFAPHNAPGFRERMQEARDGKSFEDFAAEVRDKARQAFNYQDRSRRPAGFKPERQAGAQADAPAAPTVDEAVAAAPEDPYAELHIAQAAVREEVGDDAVSMDEAMQAFASMMGGDTQPSATAAPQDDADVETAAAAEDEEDFEELDDIGRREGFFDVAPAEPPKPYEASESGDRVVDVDFRDVKELTADEAKAFAGVAKMLAEVVDPAYGVNDFKAVLRKIVPGIRDKDMDQLVEAYNSDTGYFGDEEWAWSTDTDDEGLAQDGFENNNARNVEVIQKSPIIRRLLAMMSKVSPATGRDFQPFVEDLRSFVSIAPTMFADRLEAEKASGRTDLQDALNFLDVLLNPRAQAFETAALREDAFNAILDWFAPGVTDDAGRTRVNPKRDVIRRHIATFVKSTADSPVLCARAAVFLAYLSQIRNDNARRQLAQLIASSAPSSPVRLQYDRDVEGNRTFMIAPIRQRPGTLSSEAITAQFARWVGRPASELREAAQLLKKNFQVVQDRLHYRVDAAGRKTRPAIVTANRTGLFDTYATVLAKTFGADAPVVAAFTSMRHIRAVAGNKVHNQSVLLSKFVSDTGLPYAVTDLVEMMNAVADRVGDGVVPAEILEEAAIGLFQSGAPVSRHVNRAQSSLQGRGAWSILLRGYADTKPVTVMRAEIDQTRTNKPASSLAITMAGVEPVIQLFLDRTDEKGFRAVVDELFPKQKDKPLDRYRSRLAWPDSMATSIVVKNVVKTAYATEVLAGCRAAYEAEVSKQGPRGWESTGMVYVPMFSGDHSSSVIIQVPLNNGRLVDMVKARTGKDVVEYDDVAKTVSSWFGLDLFGTDAKRSAVTSLEAPGVSLVGIKRDGNGDVIVDSQGRPETGHVTYGVVWNSRPDANNESMLGTLQMYGYGAKRIRQMARDPNSATLKVHVSAVAPDKAFGAIPTLTKALTVGYARGDAERTGTFVEGSVLRTFADMIESATSDAESTYILADYDSVKLDVLNSKMVGVSDGKGGIIPLMSYVFDTRLRNLLDAGQKITELTGDELDDLVGDIPFVNRAESAEPVTKKLSELVPDVKIRQVPGAEGMYVLERSADHLMAFQVANVSHAAHAETSQTARNYMGDALAMATTLEDINAAQDSVRLSRDMPGVKRIAEQTRKLVTSWGVLAAAIGHDERSIDNLMAQDEEWQDAMNRGEPVGGPVYQQYRRKAYAAWVKSQLRTLPMKNIMAPLVSNCSWVNPVTGVAETHATSPMFRDTLQGARTLSRVDQKFYRAAKRVAICNVNNMDASFRYGMYVDEEGLLSDTALANAGLVATDGKNREQNVVMTLENVITQIVSSTEDTDGLRLALAEHLLDHHGKTLASRRYEVVRRNRKTGETETIQKVPALEVSYLDLFTSIGSADGSSHQFDRAAVYTGMHDAEGVPHMYLGGTMFGLPRTPSYNGSMWLQVVRAGLPVTERTRTVEVDGQTTEQWLAGYDAMVAPDPFTLKILGCDHDGDKANLYMLDTQGNGRFFNKDAKAKRDARIALKEGREEPEVPYRSYRFEDSDLSDLFAEVDDIARLASDGANVEEMLARYRQRLIESGVLQYEVRRTRNADGSITETEGRLRFSPQAAARLNNTWVQSLFDMNRALPTPEGAGKSFYSGTVVTEANRGLVGRGTKATPTSKAAKPDAPAEAIPEHATDASSSWDTAVLKAPGALAPEVLNAAKGKTILDPTTAATVQTGAAFVSDARGRFVKAAGDMHILYALGIQAGVTAGMDGMQFVDYMYHQDGMSNMSFDDMKEQICSRLGLLPGMVETFLYEFGVANGPAYTDAQANENVLRFAKRVNDPHDLYHYLLRASNPADTEFVDLARKLPAFPTVRVNRDTGLQELVNDPGGRLGELAKLALETSGGINSLAAAFRSDAASGLAAYVEQSSKPVADVLREILAWREGVSVISDASMLASALNYTKMDPGDPYAGGTADRMRRTFVSAVKSENAVSVERRAEMYRMFAASQLMMAGPGSAVAARGVKSVQEYRRNRDEILEDLGSTPANTAPSYELALVVAAENSPKVAAKNRMQAAGNAYMVGMAAAAFTAPRVVQGSSFNGDLFQKCSALAEAVASVRRPAREGAETSYANATLDFRYAVESMADIFSRLLASSTVGRELPVYNYLVEYPDAGPYAYAPGKFGDAARGVSRITLGLGDVTASQLRRVQDYWRRIVDGRDLDTDGSLGKAPYASVTGGKGFVPSFGGKTVSFEFSVENLTTLRKYLQVQENYDVFKQVVQRERGEENVSAQDTRAVREGRERLVLDDLDMLIGALKKLEENKALFPEGVRIQPSALFGQLLPAYAAITDLSEEAPGPGSRSLLALFPGEYARQATEVRRMLSSPRLSRALSVAEAIDWSPVLAYMDSEYGDELAVDTAAALSRSSQARLVGQALASKTAVRRVPDRRGGQVNRITLSLPGRGVTPMFVQGHRTLGVFDGVRSVAFGSLLNCIKHGPGAEIKVRRAAPSAVAQQKPIVQQKPVLQRQLTVAKFSTTNSHRIKDERKFNQLGGLTKFIGFGPGSTGQYARDLASIANQENYSSSDIVGVSVNGDRPGAVPVRGTDVERLVRKAAAAGATIIADDAEHRNNGYNVGEVELAKLLTELGYQETGGVWRPGRASVQPLAVSQAQTVDVAHRLGSMFRAWRGLEVQYGSKPGQFTILANLQVDKDSPDARLYKTRINVNLLRPGDLSEADIDKRLQSKGYVDSVLERAHVSEEAFKAMTLAQKRDLVRQWRPVGKTTFKFDDAPGSFRFTTDDLETLTANVYLNADAVSGATDFHEAFHAVLGFVRATGVLSTEDIAVLQKKYGRKVLEGGQEWFNEEAAAIDYQKVMQGEVAKMEDRTPQGIWAKLKAFFSVLLDHLKSIFSEGHYASDYGNELQENPLMQIMLSGQAESSVPENRVITTDVRGALVSALENAIRENYRQRGYDPELEDLDLPTMVSNTGLDPWEYVHTGVGITDYQERLTHPERIRPAAERIAAALLGEVSRDEMHHLGYDDTTPRVQRTAIDAVLSAYGPRMASTKAPLTSANITDPVDVTPNPRTESSVAEILPQQSAAEGGFALDIDFDGIETTTDDARFDVARVLPRVRQALAGIDHNRMAVPYSEHEMLAASIGAAIRDGFTDEAVVNIEKLAPEQQREYTQSQMRRMRDAIARLSDLYGKEVPAEREALLFRGLCQLGVNIENAAQCARSANVNLQKKPGKPEQVPTRSRASSATLAAAVATASAVLPSDIIETALYDIRQIADRRGRGNTFVDNVLDGKVIPMFEDMLREASDPVGLLERFNHDANTPNETFAALLSGLVSETDADGYRTGFRLADGPSDNRAHAANVSFYADHIDDPDFQTAMRTAADALFMLAASRNMYRDLGFTPGRPSDAAAFASIDPDAKSPAEMAFDLNSTVEQYADPGHEAVSFFDQGWFVAESPQAWLDSMMLPSFGKVNLRDMAQGMNRAVSGYMNRIVALRNMHAYEYGLSDLAGVNLLEVDDGYDSGFKWEAGRVVHGEREAPEAVRRYKNLTKTRTKISLTLNEQRLIDLVLKARRTYLAGGRKVITGVDGLTFSLEDSSDPEWYSRENVAKRVGAGYGRGESDIDKALHRLDLQLRDDNREPFDFIVESGDGNYGLRELLVKAICDSLRTARDLVQANELSRADVNDFVIGELDRSGLVNGVQSYRRNTRGAKFVSAAVTLDADRIEELFLKSSAYKKLTDAGRKPEWLARDAYIKPYMDLWREVRSFVNSHPFLSDGDGRFFHNVNSPLPFVRGHGVFMHEAQRVERQSSAETANQVRTKYAQTFEGILANSDIATTAASRADADTLLMLRTMFHLPEQDVESIRRAIIAGDYADVRGLNLAADGTVADMADAIYQRLVGMVWNRSDATGDANQFGGPAAITDLLEKYRERKLNDPSLVSGGSAGMSDELVHRMTGVLPASHQLGHAVQNAVEGVMNALAYRAAVINMATAPAEDGSPLCYVKPALNAAETSGVPDEVWGTVARWQARLHNLGYDPSKSGVENARDIYDKIVGSKEFDRKLYGSINPEEMDTRAVEGFWARKGVPEGESSLGELAGGFALGYAKHLFQSTKALGGKYQRAIIHRAWAYSKSLSVSFSLFFPIATRFESPIGAVGAMATLGGNISADFLRKHASELQKIWGALRGKGWITKDFIGETDFVKLLDSNDPFLAEMYQYASAIGLTLSTTNANVIEQSRGIMLQDLKNLTAFVHDKFGSKAAKRVDSISKAVFARGSEKAFAYHLNATKLAVATQMCMKLQAEAAKRGVAFDPVRDMRRYTSYINAEVGGIDPLSYAWAHPKMQNLMNSLFFSWQWTRGSWEAGGGKVIEKLVFGGHEVTPEETKYLIGRAIRMWGWVAFAFPAIAQILAKAIGMAIDPDHEDRDDEKWFIWQNEDKAAWKSCDLTPLLRAIGKRFPSYAKLRKDHPVLASMPLFAFMVTKNPFAALGALPVETEPDKPQRHTYFHLGKQAWEFYNWFDDPWKSFASKLSMPIQRLTEGVLGRSLTSLDYKQPWDDMGAVERWVTFSKDSALFNMAKAFIPFSLSGMTDMGTTGILPVIGPTSRGASKFAVVKELETELKRWAENDRRGYAYGGPIRKRKSQKAGNEIAKRNVNVRGLLATAVANGHVTEKDAYTLVDSALQTLVRDERKRVIELVPDTPDGAYDVQAWNKSMRVLQRYGSFGKNLRDNLIKRLKEQNRWHDLTDEQRARFNQLLRSARRDPYGVSKELDY